MCCTDVSVIVQEKKVVGMNHRLSVSVLVAQVLSVVVVYRCVCWAARSVVQLLTQRGERCLFALFTRPPTQEAV